MRRALPYLVAIFAVAAAAMIRGFVLAPWMNDRSPFGLFTVAILLSAWLGGFSPGLLATALAMFVGARWFVAPHSINAHHVTMLCIFFVNGCLISLVCEMLRQSRLKAITARKEVEQSQDRLRESELRFHLMADSAPVMVWMSDITGKSTWFNQPWLKFTGRAMEEETGSGWLDGVHPEDRDRCLQIYRDHFEVRKPFEMDYRLRRHDGVYRWIMDRGCPLFDGGKIFSGYIGSCLDIDERKKTEEQSESLLKFEQAARAEAEKTALLKDEFLATVSHEMRTPLTAMLGWVQLLRNGSLASDTVPQALETIERNARAQAKLIDDLLDMSRILSGRLRLDVQRINPVEAVEAAIAAAEPAAAAKRIKLASELDEHAGFVSGDGTRLQQIIWNLLNNAIKFTPSGGEVGISVRREDSRIEIAVRDTGEGIKPEFLPYVFDRFRQQDASTVRKHQGLGLGLAIVKQLVESHGGTVCVESPGPGLGAVFTVTLPMVGETSRGPVPEKPALSQSITSAKNLPSLLGARVLVVDDDDDARELLRSILAQNGASVRTASSAADAIDQFELRCPDVLVSDIGMPGKDGYELIRSIRSRGREDGGYIPAVALTAFARSDDRRRAMDAGFHLHLSKPVEPSELVTAVASLVGR